MRQENSKCVIGPNGLESMTLAQAYRIWMRYLYFAVELENSLHNEFGVDELFAQLVQLGPGSNEDLLKRCEL